MSDEFRAIALGHVKALEEVLGKASEYGLLLYVGDYDGSYYFQGEWNDEFQRYDRYYLWDD